MIGMELAVLARLVHAICYEACYDALDAGGYRAAADAISALQAHGLVKDVHGVGRGIMAKWATDEWQHVATPAKTEPNPVVVSCLCAMVSQFLCGRKGHVEIRVRDHSPSVLKDAVEYLCDIGMMKVTRRFIDVATPDDMLNLKRRGLTIDGPYEIEAIDAEFLNPPDHWETQYPDWG
jgi:hypothetical protein